MLFALELVLLVPVASSEESTPEPRSAPSEPAPEVHDGFGETITVTATRREQEVFDVPSPVTVIDRSLVERQSPYVLIDLLRGNTGVSVQQTTPGQGTPFVRGVTGSSLLMLVDGMRLNNAFFRPAPNQYFALVDPYNVERIEVVRGSASTLYGSDAIGGVVQVITPTPRFDSDEWELHGLLRGEFASADTGGIGRLSVAAGRKGLSLSGGATYQHHGDLRAGGTAGVQRPTAYDVVAANGKAFWESGKQDLLLDVQYLKQPKTPRFDALVAGFGQDAPESAVFFFEPNDRLFVHGRYRIRGASPVAEEIVAHVAFQQIDDDRRTQDLDSVEEVAEMNGDRLIGITAQAVAPWRDWMVFTYGIEVYLDEVSSTRSARDTLTGETTEIASRFPDGSTLNSFALYVEDEIRPTPDWLVILGGRISVFDVDIPEVVDRSPEVDRTSSEPTGTLAVEYRLTESVALATNVGRGFRVPNVFDFAQVGSRPGNRFAVPSPDLEPETSLSVDAGVKWRQSVFSGELFGFLLRVSDKIEDRPTGEVRPDGRIVVRGQNVNAVDYAGVEFGARVLLGSVAEPYASVNYTFGEEFFEDGSEQPADRVPPVNGQVGALVVLSEDLWLEPFVRFAGSQHRLSGRDRIDPRIDPMGTTGWGTLNIRAGWWLSEHLEARLTLENILDAEYREHGSGLDAPGVNAIVGLEAVW